MSQLLSPHFGKESTLKVKILLPNYSRTSMARISVGPLKFVLDWIVRVAEG